MKNIHVLPTDKPSRLHLTEFEEELIFTPKYEKLNGINIYITSDEEIREGDFFLHPFNTIHKAGGNLIDKDFKKIILTTDQDLIKDGVQAIDDEFLEWFVKNPSCESVGVNKYHGISTSIAEVNAISGDGSLNWKGKSDLRDYKIIIPKEVLNSISSKNIPSEFNDIVNKEFFNLIEEPKQETLEEGISDYDITSNIRYGDNVGERIKIKATIKSIESKKETLTYTEAAKKEERIFNSTMMSKQETLEEVAENELRKQNWDTTITLPFNGGFIEGFQQGAKWQQEQDKNKFKNYPVIIVRNDDKEEFIHLSNGMYRTKWGILHDSISSTPLESFDKSKFTFYYE